MDVLTKTYPTTFRPFWAGERVPLIIYFEVIVFFMSGISVLTSSEWAESGICRCLWATPLYVFVFTCLNLLLNFLRALQSFKAVYAKYLHSFEDGVTVCIYFWLVQTFSPMWNERILFSYWLAQLKLIYWEESGSRKWCKTSSKERGCSAYNHSWAQNR